MTKRRTFTEALAQTNALSARRGAAKVRTSRALRERLAPKPPDAAIRAYSSVMTTYADRVRGLVEKHVLSRLPVVGSGGGLDAAALERGLAEMQAGLDKLAEGVARSARAAGKRVSAHGRREVARVMEVVVPVDHAAVGVVERFVAAQIAYVRKIGVDQVAQIRKAMALYEEGDSFRKTVLDALWVSRNRGQLLANDQANKLHEETIEQWARSVGSSGYVWATRRDERVRPGHARLDGTTHSWDDPPNTGRLEGNNHPGGAIRCRCRALPAEAPGLQR